MAKLDILPKINTRPIYDRTKQVSAEDFIEIQESVNTLYDIKADLINPIFEGLVLSPKFSTIADNKISFVNNTIITEGLLPNIDLEIIPQGSGKTILQNVQIEGGKISNVLFEELFYEILNPDINEAVSTDIVNKNQGVLITLTNPGNIQTIQIPTSINIKKFTVINNDTSTFSIIVNQLVLEPGRAQTWIFDGTEWSVIDIGITQLPIPVVQGGTGIQNYSIGDLLFANSTTTLEKKSAVEIGNVLISQGVNTAPIWSNIIKINEIKVQQIISDGIEVDIDLNIDAKGNGNINLKKNVFLEVGKNLDLTQSNLLLADGHINANKLQNIAKDLGENNVEINLSNSNTTYETNLTLNGNLTTKTINLLSLQTQENSFLIIGGTTTPKTLQVLENSQISGINTNDVSLPTNSGLTLTEQNIALGNVGTINGTSTNSISTNSHTHELDIDKNDVGLNNVDNTSDEDKPISTSQQQAINTKEDSTNKETTILDDSTIKFPVNKVVKDYVDSKHLYYNFEDLTESTTTSTSFVNKTTFTITPVTGTYELKWCCQLTNNTDDQGSSLRIQKDSDTPYFEANLRERRGIPGGNYPIYSGFIIITLTNTEMSFKIDFKALSNTAHIKNVNIILTKL